MCVTPERKLRFDQLLVGAEPLVLEAGDFGLEKGRLRKICERRPAPKPERLTNQLCRTGGVPAAARLGGFRDQRPESLSVELAGRERDRIAGATGLDPSPRRASVIAERPAQPGDVHLHALRRARRRLVGPEVVHDAVERDRLVGVQEEARSAAGWPRSTLIVRPLSRISSGPSIRNST